MSALVAIVGRPNVGKSTLFNRLIRERRSIVADEPGVTRDRIYAEATLEGDRVDRVVTVVDTGGFDPKNEDPIMQRVLDQTQLAMDEADVVVFMVDMRAGLLPEDREIAHALRKANKPVVIAANKSDGDKHEAFIGEFHELGFESVLPISATHGRGISDLVEQIIQRLPSEVGAPTALIKENAIRVAVIGRPNVGKSSLVNRLLGEDRHLVSDVAGTTRDAIDSIVDHGDQQYVFIDTAGIRRKRSIAMRLEKFSVFAALKGLERADVALLLLDSTTPIADQDAKVSAHAFEKGRAIILVVSKWDARNSEVDKKTFLEKLRQELGHLAYAPVIFTSSKSGEGLNRLFPKINEVHEQNGKRVATGELNRLVERLMDHHPPPTKRGKRGRLFYITQIGARPPRFLVHVNDPELIHFSYRRYLVNEIRKEYGFTGVPLLVGYRGRKAKE